MIVLTKSCITVIVRFFSDVDGRGRAHGDTASCHRRRNPLLFVPQQMLRTATRKNTRRWRGVLEHNRSDVEQLPQSFEPRTEGQFWIWRQFRVTWQNDYGRTIATHTCAACARCSGSSLLSSQIRNIPGRLTERSQSRATRYKLAFLEPYHSLVYL